MGRRVTIEIDEQGQEHITETITPEGWQVCDSCNGWGYVEDDFYHDYIPCQDCSGEGMIEE